MTQLHVRDVGLIFSWVAAGCVCSCAPAIDQPIPMMAPGGEAQQGATSATEPTGQTTSFEPLGPLSCQSSAPSELLTAPACDGEPIACDASLVRWLEQLLEDCSYSLNESSLELFLQDGCTVGFSAGREDPAITDDARRCVREGLGRARTDCAKPLCIHVEHGTLAAL